jgi:PadR family transcriptional regulator, regulatory protein PadR
MRKTYALVELAMALMSDPKRKHWGYDLSRQSGVRSGVMYPLLTRLLDKGWLEDGWEDADPAKTKRPPRRYYEITDLGRIELGAIVQEARSDQRFRNARAVLPGGIAPAGGYA